MNAPFRNFFNDTLASLISGLGGAKDRTQNVYHFVNELDRGQLEAMYRSDWIARKIIRAPAQDATREWRAWQAENDEIELIEEVERKFCIQEKTLLAQVKERLYGGAAIILGVANTGNPDEELDLERVKKDSLQFVHVVSRHDLSTPDGLEDDLLSPYFARPKMYERRIRGGTLAPVRIHPSRVVVFPGEDFPDANMSTDGWGESVLQGVYDAVRAAGIVLQSVATTVEELKVDVIKIPELTDQLGGQESTDRLTQRLAYGMTSKSTLNALVMDKEDEWQRIQQTFGGLPDVIKTYLLVAAGAADIPATRLLGQSPAGLNSTGESDIRNYYDKVSSDQKTILTPRMTPLDEVIVRSALGRNDKSLFYLWNPLWQMTPAEKADIANKKADVVKKDVDMMLIPTDVLRTSRENQLIEDGTYPGLEQALEDTDGEVVNPKLEAQLALAEKNAELNPPVPPGEKPAPKKPPPFAKDEFDPRQPRDPDGKWAATASGVLATALGGPVEGAAAYAGTRAGVRVGKERERNLTDPDLTPAERVAITAAHDLPLAAGAGVGLAAAAALGASPVALAAGALAGAGVGAYAGYETAKRLRRHFRSHDEALAALRPGQRIVKKYVTADTARRLIDGTP